MSQESHWKTKYERLAKAHNATRAKMLRLEQLMERGQIQQFRYQCEKIDEQMEVIEQLNNEIEKLKVERARLEQDYYLELNGQYRKVFKRIAWDGKDNNFDDDDYDGDLFK